jgi:hypothetical protein
VDGVDDDRDARDLRRDASVQTRLRVVRMHDVGPERAEATDELDECARVFAGRHAARRVLQRDVADAARRQLRHIRAGCRRADDVIAARDERFELRSEEPLEAHVGRRHVHDQRPGHVVAPA